MSLMRRRSDGRVSSSIWPGFVDAMTALLLVLMFVLTIFMVVQFVLRETITGQDQELNSLSSQLATLADALGLEQSRADGLQGELQTAQEKLASQAGVIAGLLGQRSDLQAELLTTQGQMARVIDEKEAAALALANARHEIDAQSEAARLAAAKREALEALIADLNVNITDKTLQLKNTQTALSEKESLRLVEVAAAKVLQDRLQNSQDALSAMTLALEAKRKQAEDTLTLLAAAKIAQEKHALSAGQHLSEAEKQAALLAQANALLGQEKSLNGDAQRKMALLNQQTSALLNQLNSLQGLLDGAKAKDSDAKIQIETLGRDLNTALARVASEQKRRAELEALERKRLEAEAKDLKKFRSEFFGRLRDVLGTQEGVRIVGDRFVFSSEILFTAGSAELGVQGQAEIKKVASIILDVADKIPPQIDWVLRVDGHTDNTPLSGQGRYRDNWELSQARALSVVKYLIQDLGIPAGRLAANGFGEFQPIVQGTSPKALAMNRRIELKFTEK